MTGTLDSRANDLGSLANLDVNMRSRAKSVMKVIPIAMKSIP